jgi:hypothetical protein
MTTRDVQVQVCDTTEHSTYSFVCPTCQLLVNKEATSQVVEILVGAGVKVVSWSLPAELSELHWGEPVSHDDLLGFHFLVQEDGWLERAVSGLGADPSRAGS